MDRQDETANIIIRLMAGIPEELNRSLHDVSNKTGSNLYKYRNGNASPLIITFLTYCFTLDLDPGVFISLACRVQTGELSEKQALQILAHNESFKQTMDSFQRYLIREYCQVPVSH